MSLRGFKRDIPATEAAHFSDARSFISLPKIIVGECTEPKPHLVLHGVDKGPIRAEIFRLNRLANGNTNRCWKCGKELVEDAAIGDPVRGEWHHLRNKPGTRCDCPENGVVSCGGPCHQSEHLQVHLHSGKIIESPEELY